MKIANLILGLITSTFIVSCGGKDDTNYKVPQFNLNTDELFKDFYDNNFLKNDCPKIDGEFTTFTIMYNLKTGEMATSQNTVKIETRIENGIYIYTHSLLDNNDFIALSEKVADGKERPLEGNESMLYKLYCTYSGLIEEYRQPSVSDEVFTYTTTQLSENSYTTTGSDSSTRTTIEINRK